jgi:hypothetical protein
MFCFSFTWTADGAPSPESRIIRMRAECVRWLATRHGRGWDKLNGCRYVLHDRDARLCPEFRESLAAGGGKCLRLPLHGPNLNAFAECWVRSVQQECLLTG